MAYYEHIFPIVQLLQHTLEIQKYGFRRQRG